MFYKFSLQSVWQPNRQKERAHGHEWKVMGHRTSYWCGMMASNQQGEPTDLKGSAGFWSRPAERLCTSFRVSLLQNVKPAKVHKPTVRKAWNNVMLKHSSASIYMRSRKKKGSPEWIGSLGVWRLWERVEGEWGVGRKNNRNHSSVRQCLIMTCRQKGRWGGFSFGFLIKTGHHSFQISTT